MERFRNIVKRVDPVGWIVPALVVAVWFWLSASGHIPAYKLPSPMELFRVLTDLHLAVWASHPIPELCGKIWVPACFVCWPVFSSPGTWACSWAF